MCSVLRTKNKQTKKKKPLQGIFPFARWSICTLQLACRVLCWCFDDEPGVYCSPSSSSSSPGTQTTSTGASGSHLQSAKLPQREAPASSLAHSLAASSTGRVGKCLQWFPSKSGSLGSTTFAATGEPRQVALGWVRLAAARWPPFSFPPGQDGSEGYDSVCVRVQETRGVFVQHLPRMK